MEWSKRPRESFACGKDVGKVREGFGEKRSVS